MIVQPPFARPGADIATRASKTTFKNYEHSDAVKDEMQDALAQKEIRVANGINGLGSYFVEMADRKLKAGGVMGFTPVNAVNGHEHEQGASHACRGISRRAGVNPRGCEWV